MSLEELVAAHAPALRRHVAGQRPAPLPPAEAIAALLGVADHVAFVRALEGWILPTSYLRDLYRRTQEDDSAYRFDHRIRLLMRMALPQPSGVARARLAPLLGEVPYLPGGVLDYPEDLLVPPDFLAEVLDVSLPAKPEQVEVHGDITTAQGLAAATVICPDAATDGRVRRFIALQVWDAAGGVVDLPDLRAVVRVGSRAAIGPEGQRCEFKRAFDWNPRTGHKDGDLRLGVMRTIAAFLNSQGGTLWLGIGDDGSVVGLDEEIAAMKKPSADGLELRLREAIRRGIEPPVVGLMETDWHTMEGRQVLEVRVPARPGVHYLLLESEPMDERIYVRDGSRTVRLVGRERDIFVLERSGQVLVE